MSLVEVPDDLLEFNRWAVENRWSDGLPIIPPTQERVDEMLFGTSWEADAVVAKVPPRLADATVERIAANAVMAGCTPAAMPILIAATQAILEPTVNLYGAQATTHPCAIMLMVTGPLADAAGIHGGTGLFGPGFHANASIGRALRLIQQNIGGAWPIDTDRATHGTPAKFSFCFGENTDPAENLWPTYRSRLGISDDHSTVTVCASEGPHNINDHVSSTPQGVLFTIAQTIATVGTNNAYIPAHGFMVGVCPEHVKVLDDHGFTPGDVQQYIFERARIPYKHWKIGGMVGMLPQPKHLDAADDDYPVAIVDSPDKVHVVVLGGPGRHSVWMPNFGITNVHTQVIQDQAGSPITL